MDFELDDANDDRARLRDQVDCEGMNLPFKRGGAVDSAVREACETGKEDNFDGIIDAFVDNLPLLAFMVIPVMAVVFKVFYAFSGRNYLAHLVFLCHTHAFTFLLFVVITVLRYIGWAAPSLSQTMTVLGGLLFVFYPPVYYFLAMRRVYGQGRLLTLVKELLLMFVYMFAVMLVFATGFIAVILAN